MEGAEMYHLISPVSHVLCFTLIIHEKKKIKKQKNTHHDTQHINIK